VLVASIDVYNLKGDTLTQDDLGGSEQIQENLSFVYYDDYISNAVVEQLKKVFEQHDILNYFDFVKVSSVEEMEGKLLAGDYDIVLNTINMGFKKDISAILSSEKVQINHSQYKNPRLITLIQQYLQTKDKSSLAGEINDIYAKDMPFVMLGTSYEPLYIKEATLAKFAGSGTDLHQENRRQEIYKNMHLVQNINIDVDNAWSLKKFILFLKYGLK
jgi:ABC-type transport system substrate-binding protein